jgi:hypothetical protein
MASIAPIRKLDDLVVTIVVTKEFQLRIWVAVQLVRLASFILGGRIEIKDND